jgi:hypothetical protein
MKARFRLELIIALAVMLVLVVLDLRVAGPKRGAAAAAARRIEQAEQELQYLGSHGQELGEIARFLPRQPEEGITGDERFLSYVSSEARRLSVAMIKVEPAGEQPYGAYLMRRYRLSFEGSYYGFAALLRSLETLPETVTVTGFECTSREVTNTARHKATIEMSVIGR